MTLASGSTLSKSETELCCESVGMVGSVRAMQGKGGMCDSIGPRLLREVTVRTRSEKAARVRQQPVNVETISKSFARETWM